MSKSARSRHNKHQRELYQKQKKAKRAQLAEQAVDAASGVLPDPTEPMDQEEAIGGTDELSSSLRSCGLSGRGYSGVIPKFLWQ